jgi:hypothetical protein
MLILAGGMAALFSLGWLGLQIQPAPFPVYPQQQPALDTVPLPADLPAPVARYYRRLYGERVPVIHSAVISGRARLRVMGIPFPARFRFIHVAGQHYRHYIEATVFGLPMMKVNESYVDGEGRAELPVGTIENEPKNDQAANLGLWAESVWLPSIWLTDPRVRWEAVDEETALLAVPFGEDEECFVARFDPDSGLLRFLEAMRYQSPDSAEKTLWITESHAYQSVNGHTLPAVGSATWFDAGVPWAVFTVEEIIYNTDAHAYVRAKGL